MSKSTIIPCAMSHDTESVMSSAISVSGTESFSDDGSTLNAGDSKPAMSGATGPGNGLFDLGDGDLRLMISGITLETHKFIIKKFASLKSRIENDMIVLGTGEPEEGDFKNTFKILYASVVEGPFEFDSSILKSALLLATRYDYPALRAFSINKLEQAALSAVERIRLAREFDIPSWEEPAYLELCERDEALSMSEAAVLGLETMVHMARIREKEQRRRGKEVDAVEGVKNRMEKDRPGQSGRSKPIFSSPSFARSNLDKDKGAGTGTTQKNVKAIPKPSFINTQALSPSELRSHYSASEERGNRISIVVPDCECAVAGEVRKIGSQFIAATPTLCQCKLPPCAVSAFKNLQTQQLAHETSISALETSVEWIQDAVTSLKSTTERSTETALPAPKASGTLQEDVQRWLIRQRSGALIV